MPSINKKIKCLHNKNNHFPKFWKVKSLKSILTNIPLNQQNTILYQSPCAEMQIYYKLYQPTERLLILQPTLSQMTALYSCQTKHLSFSFSFKLHFSCVSTDYTFQKTFYFCSHLCASVKSPPLKNKLTDIVTQIHVDFCIGATK